MSEAWPAQLVESTSVAVLIQESYTETACFRVPCCKFFDRQLLREVQSIESAADSECIRKSVIRARPVLEEMRLPTGREHMKGDRP